MEPKWDSITSALDPFSTKPSMDPDTQYMVARPETAELDGVIQNIEEQLGELQARRNTHQMTSHLFLIMHTSSKCVGGFLGPVVSAGETDS